MVRGRVGTQGSCVESFGVGVGLGSEKSPPLSTVFSRPLQPPPSLHRAWDQTTENPGRSTYRFTKPGDTTPLISVQVQGIRTLRRTRIYVDSASDRPVTGVNPQGSPSRRPGPGSGVSPGTPMEEGLE